MSGVAPDPLDRIADSIATAKLDKVWVALSYPEADALVEVARAARDLESHFDHEGLGVADMVALQWLRAALARLEGAA